MRKKGLIKCISVVIALCIMLSCLSFASVGAATSGATETVSASSASTGGNTFSWDNATVYFLLTDRFRNGNTSNDHSYGRATDANGNPLSGWDTAPGTFHGGDFAGITQTIEEGYFDNLGVNALWISAPYEQIHGYVDSGKGFAHYSYHGYYVLDYTETDANFGTAEEFETLVDTAHEHGLRVVIDIVMNHSGYNNIADMEEFNYGTLLSGASEFKYKLNDVSDLNNHIDFSSSATDWGRWWGSDWVRSGLPGYTEGGGDDLTRSLEGLPDFRTDSSATVGIPSILKTKWTKEGTYNQKLSEYGSSNTVRGYLTDWLSDWVRKYGVDGFRCDTAKHVEMASWKTLSDKCTTALEEWRASNPNKPGADWDEEFWMTGECWDHNVGWGYDSYFTQGGFDSMINFETQGGGMLSSGNVAGVYQNYADSINTNDNFNALSYISSHDSVLARDNLISTGSALLMLPGGVQIFYGDETNRSAVSGLAFDGNGGSGHSLRSDMNWDSIDENVLQHWQKVGTFRNSHISVGAGANTSLSSTSGTAFGRTYSKNGISDKVAGVIYAGSNTNVTVDVSALWSDGQQLMNAYDQSSATVTGGKVTFNSGANGTILIQEPDGRPLMSVKGNSKFSGTQTVTVSLEDCESAKCSIDGGNKFVVKDGDTFVIGPTAYDGDTITVTLEGENENGSATSTAYFVKVAEGQSVTEPTTEPAPNGKLYVKTWDGSGPYAYVWKDSSTALLGAWPGTMLTEKNSEGYYVIEVPTTGTYNVVLNNGSGTQSGDIESLSGDTYIEVTNSSYSTNLISTGSGGGGGGSEPSENSVTIRVKPYDNTVPYLYVWTGTSTELNGAWPGNQLSEKDADGNYVFTAENCSSCNAIVNLGSNQNQTDDIEGISGDVTIEITNSSCSAYKLTKYEAPVSGMALLKKEAREVKAMTSSDYTSDSWSNVSSVMTAADSVIADGDLADESIIESTTVQLQNAKAALKLAAPVLSYAVAGNSTVKGVTVAAADVTVTINGKAYETTSDDVTGEFEVTGATVTSSTTIKVDVTRKGLSSDTYSYNMSNGNIEGYVPPTTEPSTSAPQPTQPVVKIGDVNGDGTISVLDATEIQKHLAQIITLDSDKCAVADTDGDGKISIKDATKIQKFIAGLISEM